MASKKEILATVVAAVSALCVAEDVTEEFEGKLMAVLNENLAPKSGGATVVLEDVYNAEDETILCSVSGVWLPATVEYFYEEKAEGKGINGLKRLSRQAESIRKTAIKVLNTTEKAIMADVLGGDMSPEDGQEKLTAAKAVKPDYSGVGVIEESDED